MKKFLITIMLFLSLGLLIGEIIARIFVLTSDIPRRIIDSSGIQKYIPDQKGSWINDTHTWQINEMGWPGPLPKSKINLITLIGDSYIENFMNPDECHQSVYLKRSMPNYNFLEASRSGVSFIESMEITKQLDSLAPKYQLIYLHESDFAESIVQIKKVGDITQLDLNGMKIIYGKLKSPIAKRILYNWKFIYYLYNRFYGAFNSPSEKGNAKSDSIKISPTRAEKYRILMEYVKNHYEVTDKILIFRPGTNKELVQLVERFGFKTLHLTKAEHEQWSFDYDKHWTCTGHVKAAEQVTKQLTDLLKG